MALINKAKREINAKIVYYGRPGTGKELSLRYIYDRLKPTLRGEFKTMTTMGDSLQFFDFSPFEAPMFGGYRICFHVYTLAGTVHNPAAWKMTLKGADGVLLATTDAADALAGGRNSFATLRDYFGGYGISLNDVPLVLQIGKNGSDPAVSVDELRHAFGVSDVPAFLAQPANGEGVLEALSKLSQMVLERIGHDVGGEQGDAPPPDVVPEPVVPSDIPEQPELPESMASAVAVAVAGEPQAGVHGTVTIPLELMVSGENRRLVLTISVSEE